ncbi:glycosyltransferase [Puia sp. P3]|uniref:glycosyltransferase n=1 Tax=Puia sp. P3 TaxID=3423952 RepID=UPI003D679088
MHDLAKICEAKGLEVRILQNANSFFLRNFDNIPVVGLPGRTGHDLEKMSERYDVYCKQSHLIIASPLDLACNLHYSSNCIGINHGIYWDDKYTSVAKYDINKYKRIFRAQKNCTKSICVDTNFINWLRTYDWELASKCEYVPNYVDRRQFSAVEKEFDGKLTVIYPRRLYEARGLYITIEAFASLLPKYPDLNLHFVGQAVGDDAIATRLFISQFKSQVSWYELDMEKMDQAFRQSHIALIPTKYAEGTSLSCLEAMATNNGVIATNIGGLPNLILNNFNGMLINPEVASLTNAVERLINDRQLLKTLASNALLTADAFRKEQVGFEMGFRHRRKFNYYLVKHHAGNQKMQPLISIILPTFNGSRYLKSSIESCLNQSYPNFELILVDDCSTDDTASIIEQYSRSDSRVRAIHNEVNLNLPSSLNKGFAIAKGGYFTWTSDDNLFGKNALEVLLDKIQTEGADIIYSSYYVINDTGGRLDKLGGPPEEIIFKSIVGACFLYKRSVHEQLGDTTHPNSDWKTWTFG